MNSHETYLTLNLRILVTSIVVTFRKPPVLEDLGWLGVE